MTKGRWIKGGPFVIEGFVFFAFWGTMQTHLYVAAFLTLLLTACGGNFSTPTPEDISAAAIVGGKDTTKDHIASKYVVMIFDNATQKYCTGALIRKDIVITAAHCLGSKAESLTLAFGLKPMAGDYIMRPVAKVLLHEGFSKGNLRDRNDLALLRIKGEAPAGYKMLLLPEPDFIVRPNQGFTAVGYGRTSGSKASPTDNQGSGHLRHVDLIINSLSENENQFYVDQTTHRGICNGDSGGPGLMRWNGQDYVVGIVSAMSWTSPDEASSGGVSQDTRDICAEKSIYISVKKYRTWINDGIKKLTN